MHTSCGAQKTTIIPLRFGMMTCLSGISCRQQNTKVEGSAANDQRVCRGYGGVVSHTHLCNQSVCLAGTLVCFMAPFVQFFIPSCLFRLSPEDSGQQLFLLPVMPKNHREVFLAFLPVSRMLLSLSHLPVSQPYASVLQNLGSMHFLAWAIECLKHLE